MSSFTDSFEEKFVLNLPKKFYGKNIAIGVSGGADSMALLNVCLRVQKITEWNLFVISINHMIREKSESEGDCNFVKQFCDKNNVNCKVISAEQNQIFCLEKQRNRGIEEAARFFRYSCFENFSNENEISWIFLAHNKNDQIETILQRYLQGSFGKACLGIPLEREKFFRPFLNFSRSEIERYLKDLEVPFRIDKTNFDDSYFRNKIRNKLIPFLDKNFDKWTSGLVHGSEKRSIDEDFINSVTDSYNWSFFEKNKDCLFLDAKIFNSLHDAIKIRLVYKALELIKADDRISYGNIRLFCNGKNVNTCGIGMSWKNDKVYINKLENSGKEITLFAIIDGKGDFSIGFGKLRVRSSSKDFLSCDSEKIICATLPFEFHYVNERIRIKSFKKNGEKVFVLYEKFGKQQ